MNYLRLHTEPGRQAVFRASPARPIEFDRSLQAWIVLDPNAVAALLRDPRIVACSIVDGLALLETRYGVQLPNLVSAAKKLPLGLEGRPHQTVRRQMARLLSEGQERLGGGMPELIERHFAPLARSDEIELVAECVAPLVEELFSAILGRGAAIPFKPLTIGRTFDRFTSVGTRVRIDSELGILHGQLAEMGVPDVDLTLALLMIGRDSLLATLSESLAAVARNAGGRALCDLAYPEAPPETGVSVTERTVTEDMSIGDERLRNGDRLRLYFQGFAYCPAGQDQLAMFGVGPHSCLGRRISLDVWHALAAYLSKVPRRMQLASYAVRPDPIFTMPEHVRVRLT